MLAFGSSSVRAAYERWHESVYAVQRADRTLGFALDLAHRGQAQEAGADFAKLHQDLVETAKPAEHAAREEFEARVREDLESAIT